jgi:hypothetical protein
VSSQCDRCGKAKPTATLVGRSCNHDLCADCVEALTATLDASSPVQNMLDLSTAHMPSEVPDFGEGHRIEEHDYGFIVFVAGAPPFSECAEWLQPIMVYAHEAECVLINFDRDANAYEELFQTWDW